MLFFDLLSSFLCLHSSLLCEEVDECFEFGRPARDWAECHWKSVGLLAALSALVVAILGGLVFGLTRLMLVSGGSALFAFRLLLQQYLDGEDLEAAAVVDEPPPPRKSRLLAVFSPAGDAQDHEKVE